MRDDDDYSDLADMTETEVEIIMWAQSVPAAVAEIRKRRMRRAENAARIAQAKTTERFSSIRKRIYERDGGTCQVCETALEFDEFYECGHIVDRMCGGSDLDDNLLCMCRTCNRGKPLHRTRDEFEDWRRQGGVFGEVVRRLWPHRCS